MAALVLGTFAVGIYGGYFTAAQGILLVGVMGALLPEDMQRMNAAKNLLSLVVNIVAAVAYTLVAFDRISWAAAGLIAAGSLIGGFLGAHYGRRLSPNALRAVIVVVGLIGLYRLLTIYSEPPSRRLPAPARRRDQPAAPSTTPRGGCGCSSRAGPIAVHEGPVARGERAGVLADALLRVVGAVAAVVAHLVDVGAAGGVGLGGQHAAVGMLAHPDDVGRHHPVGTRRRRRSRTTR